MVGEVCWLEVNTPDAAGAKAFYGKLFGWVDGPGEVGFPYHFLKTAGGDKNFGGVMPQPKAGGPPYWLVYFAVDDLDAAVRQVTALGGKVHSPTVTLPTGRFAVVADPTGAAFAVYQSV